MGVCVVVLEGERVEVDDFDPVEETETDLEGEINIFSVIDPLLEGLGECADDREGEGDPLALFERELERD